MTHKLYRFEISEGDDWDAQQLNVVAENLYDALALYAKLEHKGEITRIARYEMIDAIQAVLTEKK